MEYRRESRDGLNSARSKERVWRRNVQGQDLGGEQFRGVLLCHLLDLSKNLAHFRGLGQCVTISPSMSPRADTHPALDSSCVVVSHQHWTDGNRVWDPLYKPTFLVERHYAIGANI